MIRLSQLFRTRVRKSRLRRVREMWVEALEARALLAVTFQFNYQGAIGSGVGFEDATNGQARRDALELAGNRLGGIFDHTATITLDVTSKEDANDDTLAAAGSNFVDSPINGFENNEVVRTKILSGTDLNGATADGSVEVNWGMLWETSSDIADVSSTEFDFLSTMYHELLHATGWASSITETGEDLNNAAPAGQAGAWGFFDQFLADASGSPVIDNSSFALDAVSWNTNKIGGASPTAGLFFNGTNAAAANGGNAVGLYTPTTFSSGSSVTHLDDDNSALSGLMMLAVTDAGPGARNLTTLERAVLSDLGFSLVAGGITVTESVGSTHVSESGSTDTFDVVLTSAPLVDVVVNVSSGDVGETTVDKATLTFTPNNWNVAQTVTVTGVDDALTDGSQTTLVTLSIDDATSDDAFDAAVDQTVSVSTADNESPGFTITETGGSTELAESTTESFSIVLTSQPATDVVLTVASSDTGEATVSPATVTFTSANWDAAQAVTLTGVNDGFVDGNQSISITLSVDDAASDDAFDAVADQSVSAVVNDISVAAFAATPSTVLVTESGGTSKINLRLLAQPASDVVFSIVASDATEAAVNIATATFTSANWSVVQEITVTGLADGIQDGNQTSSVTISIDDAQSADAFDGLADSVTNVITTDIDGVGINLSDTLASVSETGTRDVFTVVLNSQPATDVVLDLVSQDVGEVTVDVASLTFTNSNWNTPQTVTVTGVDDSVLDQAQVVAVIISVNDAASDDQYDGMSDVSVSVTVADDERLGVPTVTAPSGISNNQRPTVEWEAVADATAYDIWINKIGTPNTIAFRQQGVTGTSFTLPIDLESNARYLIWVRAVIFGGPVSAYSIPQTYTVGAPPQVPALTAPSGITTARPTFEWAAVATATSYDLWVNQIDGTVRIIREQTLTGSNFTATSDLPDGQYKAWIRAQNEAGFSLWSAATSFVVGTAPGQATVLAPQGPTSARPTFQWSVVENAATYELWVNQVGGTVRIVHETSLTGTSFDQSVNLPSGIYRVWVRAVSSAGIRGLWSDWLMFQV